MSTSIVVFGPARCGKTRNAERLRKALGCRFVIDEGLDFDPDRRFPSTGALILTNNEKLSVPSGVRRMAFNHAMHLARLADKAAKAGLQ